MESIKKIEELIEKAKKELEQLQSQLPKHSIQPSMILQIDELDDELAKLQKKLKKIKQDQ